MESEKKIFSQRASSLSNPLVEFLNSHWNPIIFANEMEYLELQAVVRHRKIIKELGKKEGVITTSIDPKLAEKLRLVIPSLKSD